MNSFKSYLKGETPICCATGRNDWRLQQKEDLKCTRGWLNITGISRVVVSNIPALLLRQNRNKENIDEIHKVEDIHVHVAEIIVKADNQNIIPAHNGMPVLQPNLRRMTLDLDIYTITIAA